MNDHDPYARWLGRPLDDVPSRLREAVFEYVFGASVIDVATYAAGQAASLLRFHDPDMRDTYADIAQDVLVQFLQKLPAERVTFWKTYTHQGVLWQIQQQRRKRHPGREAEAEAEAEDTIAGLADPVSADQHDWLYVRDQFARVVRSIPDAETRRVFEATCVWPTEHSGFDVRTAEQVAALLGISSSKVKRLWSKEKRALRHLLTPGAHDETEPTP